MNVGHPSNLARLISLYGGVMDEKGIISKEPDYELMNKELFSASIGDDETRETIKNTFNDYKTILEPHGAVGWAGLNSFIEQYGNDPEQVYVSLETAHPAKFPEEIQRILGFDPELPQSLKGLEGKPEYVNKIENNYPSFKEWLIKNLK
jgi:threonine synthase